MKYVIFLRLLCQEIVTKEDIVDVQKLINDFVYEYESLYSHDAMTSNVHGHLHLPQQVWRFGPLNKLSCFPFENQFKMTRNCFHGTRNFEGQIAINFERMKMNKRSLKTLENETTSVELKFFICNHLKRKTISSVDCLSKIKKKKLTNFMQIEVDLIKKFHFENELHFDFENELISFNNKAIILNREYHTVKYDENFETLNNHCVEFKTNFNIFKYGQIINFIVLGENKACIIREYEKIEHDYFFTKLTNECLKHIDRFFFWISF